MKELKLKQMKELNELYRKVNVLSILKNYKYTNFTDFIKETYKNEEEIKKYSKSKYIYDYIKNIINNYGEKNIPHKRYYGKFYVDKKLLAKLKENDVNVSNFIKFCLYTNDFYKKHYNYIENMINIDKKEENYEKVPVRLNETEFVIYNIYNGLFGIKNIVDEDLYVQYLKYL